MTQTGPQGIFAFDDSYTGLPERFYARLQPTPVAAPRLIRVNEGLAFDLGLDSEALKSPAGVALLSGNMVQEGSAPLAAAYAGHQFGSFVPQLGDGRAILLGEVVDRGGVRRDIQLKGSGPTPFSRRGDGRAALGPVLREYVVSEAMAALGIPTTRTLAAVLTGERVMRDGPLPGAVLTRVAASHVRVGTFQFFAARGDADGVKTLADYVIARHYPAAADAPNPYIALLGQVIARQAALVARWLCVGFIHGVMNTDNMSVAGETIDYGPCAFMDSYHPDTVFSSIDRHSRYAYGNQPAMAQWNLARLAETLLPLLADDTTAAIPHAQEALDGFGPAFETAYAENMMRKIGLHGTDDFGLVQDLLNRMAGGKADFTLTFRRLSRAVLAPAADADVRSLFAEPAAFDAWASSWRLRLAKNPADPIARARAMDAVNPAFIPRNHLIEEMIQSALAEDFQPFEMLLKVLAHPYEDQSWAEAYALPPRPDQIVHETFCGT